MKNSIFLSIIISIFSLTAMAAEKTTLEFDLPGYYFKNNNEVRVNVAKLNKLLKKQNLAGLPERVIVSSNPAAYQKVLLKRIEAANTVHPQEIRTEMDSGYFYEYPEICYRGDIKDVVALVDSMQGNFMTSEQGILAIRYGKKKIVRSDEFKTDKALAKYYDEISNDTYEEWIDFDQDSKNVLVMSNLGPQGDGTELYATLIKPCK